MHRVDLLKSQREGLVVQEGADMRSWELSTLEGKRKWSSNGVLTSIPAEHSTFRLHCERDSCSEAG